MYVAHNTWHEYIAMSYRVLKKYNLPYRLLSGSEERVAAETATMSSYVGTIFSLDDFVTLSSGLVTTETTLFIYDSSLFEASQPLGQVFEPARVMAANRLARDGKEWTKMASRFNSGTYNNQWMVVDLSKVSGGRLDDGALWVMEQLPGRQTKNIYRNVHTQNHIQMRCIPNLLYQDMGRRSNVSAASFGLLGVLQ